MCSLVYFKAKNEEILKKFFFLVQLKNGETHFGKIRKKTKTIFLFFNFFSTIITVFYVRGRFLQMLKKLLFKVPVIFSKMKTLQNSPIFWY